MKKSYLVMAAAAALFAACSSNDLAEEKSPQTTQPTDEQAVTFDAYASRGTTRAGQTGEMTTTTLKNPQAANGGGFGVFGYYTDGENFGQTSKPTFMYNQGVFWKSSPGVWEYSPIKYWPNEFGNDANSEDVDRVTFFAYAPYVNVTPSTGALSGYTGNDLLNGITGMSRNSASGDPIVKYAITDFNPANCVDLCWGVAKNDFKNSADGQKNTVNAGEPYLNVIKPQLGDKIDFDFKHALTQLNVQIDAVVDAASGLTNALNAFTRIWIRSVTFEGFTTKGALNLNSNVSDGPIWLDVDGSTKLNINPVSIYDGLRDGKEPISAAKNETPIGLNPAIIQSKAYDPSYLGSQLVTTDGTVVGVNNVTRNLFNAPTVTDPILVIPTGEDLKITVEYDVETYDQNLAGYLSDGAVNGISINNTITKTITLLSGSDAVQMKAGKKYTVNLHLGMEGVAFNAGVSEWEPYTSGSGSGDLPSNLYWVKAGTSTNIVTLAAAATDYKFGIYDLTKGETLTKGTCTNNATSVGVTFDPATVTDTKSSVISVTGISPNTTTSKKEDNNIVINATSGNTTLSITQLPAALGITSALYNSSTKVVTMDFTATDVTDLTASGIDVIVTKNGVRQTKATHYTLTGKTVDLTNAYPAAGDVFTITIKAHDAAPETATITIPEDVDVSWSNSGNYDVSASTAVGTYDVVIGGLTSGENISVAVTTDTNSIISSVSPTTPTTVDATGRATVTINCAGGTAGQTATLTVSHNSETMTITVTVATP